MVAREVMPKGISGFGTNEKGYSSQEGFYCSLIVNFHKFIIEFFQKKAEQ